MSVLRSYRLAHETEATQALNWFKKSIFSDIPPYFMTHWKTGKSFFYGNDAILAYEERRTHLVVAGEPLVAAGSDSEDLYKAFVHFAERKGKKICGYYVGPDWFEPQFYKVPLGTSIRIPLYDYDSEASCSKEIQKALIKGDEQNYRVISLKRKNRLDQERVSRLQLKWQKKKLPFQLKFLLSKLQPTSLVDSYEEWFLVEKNGEALAFCSLLPYLINGELGFYVDHLIYDPEREPYALSFLISSLIELLKEEGVRELNLGLNPFDELESNQMMGKLFNVLYRVPYLYRPKGVKFFKKKFAGVEEREYCFFQRKDNKWLGLANIAKITFESPEIF